LKPARAFVFFCGGIGSFILSVMFYDPTILLIGASAAIFMRARKLNRGALLFLFFMAIALNNFLFRNNPLLPRFLTQFDIWIQK
jgi:hypothetical protein